MMEKAPLGKVVQYLETGEWKAAHLLVQKDASSLGCWAHGIVHLIEGDLGNAGYWYRQAGQPVANDTLEAEWERIVSALLGSGKA